MPRPCKRRRVCAEPSCGHFGPKDPGAATGQTVIMTLDEFEAIRLIDLEGRTQEELDAICAKCKVDRWAGAPPTPTPQSGAKENERDTFIHAHPNIQRDRMTRKVYALGLALADDCPENDCKVYLNIFNMARELDKALDGATGYPATVLRGALHDRLRELAEMYTSNYAVQQFKEGMQK